MMPTPRFRRSYRFRGTYTRRGRCKIMGWFRVRVLRVINGDNRRSWCNQGRFPYLDHASNPGPIDQNYLVIFINRDRPFNNCASKSPGSNPSSGAYPRGSAIA